VISKDDDSNEQRAPASQAPSSQRKTAAYDSIYEKVEASGPKPTPINLSDVITKTDLDGFEPASPATYLDYASAHSDDPWALGLNDNLGMADEAKAFARLAVARQFKPPLAIGLFGDWGTGKSFFMRLIHEHIEKLIKAQPSDEAPESGSDSFHTEVVQIRFNAWHYAETNLWASLVDHLFSELALWYGQQHQGDSEGLLENLSTARLLTLESAEELILRRREQQGAVEKLIKAQEALALERRNLEASPAIYWEAFKAWFDHPVDDQAKKDKAAFEEAAKSLGYDNLVSSAGDLSRISSALHDEAKRGALLVEGLRYRFQLKRSWVFLSLMLVAAPLLGLLAKARIPNLSDISDAVTFVSISLASVTGLIGVTLGKVRTAIRRLETAKDAVDVAVTKGLQARNEERQATQNALISKSAEVEEARAIVETASKRLAEATHNYADGSSAGRLMKFIRARATDGHYAKHLGLIATIRKDFEELSAGVSAANSPPTEVQDEARAAFNIRLNKLMSTSAGLLSKEEYDKLHASANTAESVKPAFQRIVLYIDDLDRCPPDKVVDVLQAVHLLLTFPLFVVMVAVDVRWVRRALEKQYPGLLADNETAASAGTASDYLEKIFQIPYWVRPMRHTEASAFVKARLLDASASVPIIKPAIANNDRKKAELDVRVLSISNDESDYITLLAPYIASSPRRVLRFLNVYRLIKAGLNTQDIDDLATGGFKPLMLSLAIATGMAKTFPEWIVFLDRSPENFTIETFRSVLREHPWSAGVNLEQLRSLLVAYEKSVASTKTLDAAKVLKHYATIAKRYSF